MRGIPSGKAVPWFEDLLCAFIQCRIQGVAWVCREWVEVDEGIKHGIMCVCGCMSVEFASCDVAEAGVYLLMIISLVGLVSPCMFRIVPKCFE